MQLEANKLRLLFLWNSFHKSRIQMKHIIPYALFLFGMSILLQADPGPPYGQDCLKSMDQWHVIAGQWSFQNKTLRTYSAQSPIHILFQEKGFHLPSDYFLNFTAKRLSKQDSKQIGVLFGYADEENYNLFSFTQIDELHARISMVRVRSGKAEQESTTMMENPIQDFPPIELEIHNQRGLRASIRIGKKELLSYADQTAPTSSFGFSLSSANVAITSCTISGIFKR